MKKIIKHIQIYILLMFFWIILSGKVDYKTLAFGSIFSIMIIKITYEIIFELDDDILKLPPLWRFLWFGEILLISIIKSGINHIHRIIINENKYEIFEVKLITKNSVIITLIANGITLTPGTITIGINESTLSVVGFSNGESDIKNMKEEILNYQKPFIYRRKV